LKHDRENQIPVFGERSCLLERADKGGEPCAMPTAFLRVKRFWPGAALAASLAAGGAFAQDSKLDLNVLTCQKLFEMKREQINIVLAWLQAYYLQEDAPPVVDLDKLSADTQRLSGYCAANPQEDISSAADVLFLK
jgi:acid stress chaperone HdeB